MYDLHANLVETDFEGAFAELTKRLRKRALVVLFTQVIDDVSAQAVLRQVRSLRPRHLPVCVLFRDPDLDRLAEPPTGLATAPPTATCSSRAAAAETILWRERLVRDLKTGGALVLHVPPRSMTPGDHQPLPPDQGPAPAVAQREREKDPDPAQSRLALGVRTTAPVCPRPAPAGRGSG